MGKKRHKHGFVRKREEEKPLGRPGYREKGNGIEVKLTDILMEEVTGLLRLLIGTRWTPVSITMTFRVIYVYIYIYTHHEGCIYYKYYYYY